jgi:hypothetical protein
MAGHVSLSTRYVRGDHILKRGAHSLLPRASTVLMTAGPGCGRRISCPMDLADFEAKFERYHTNNEARRPQVERGQSIVLGKYTFELSLRRSSFGDAEDSDDRTGGISEAGHDLLLPQKAIELLEEPEFGGALVGHSLKVSPEELLEGNV